LFMVGCVQPKISSWTDGGPYPSIYGQTEVRSG